MSVLSRTYFHDEAAAFEHVEASFGRRVRFARIAAAWAASIGWRASLEG